MTAQARRRLRRVLPPHFVRTNVRSEHMKNIEEIMKTPRLCIIRHGDDGGWAQAYLNSSKKKNEPATVVFSWGADWDHVSVSFRRRCPSWEEMAEIKQLFFHPEEVCFELHPAKSEYVNDHPFCLHIWRQQKETIPTPPAWMVGVKRGKRINEIVRR